MPRYSWKIDDLLFEEDVKAMYGKTKADREAVLIALLWITGARPSEIRELKRQDISIGDSEIRITLTTKKLGEGGDFKIRNRTLNFARPRGLDTNIYLETIAKFVTAMEPGVQVLPYTTRWQEKTINALGMAALGKKISPYHFRHSCLTWMASNGATIDELMSFKGALSVLSISMYMRAKPFVVSLQNQRRSRGTVAPPIKQESHADEQPPPADTQEKKDEQPQDDYME